jgi:hypothetical protein
MGRSGATTSERVTLHAPPHHTDAPRITGWRWDSPAERNGNGQTATEKRQKNIHRPNQNRTIEASIKEMDSGMEGKWGKKDSTISMSQS